MGGKMLKTVLIKAVIFDLDGTLLNTETLSTLSIQQALAPITDATFDWNLKKKLLGMRGEEWSKIVIDDLNLHDKISPIELVRQWEYNLGKV
jgi:beta-phosphoglucomutase-like phosphatase (HAD superfamily)